MKTLKALGLALTAMATLTTAPALANGSYCREFTRNVAIGGKIEQAYGTACMQPDGSWQQVAEPQFEPSTNNFYPVTPQMQVAQPQIPYQYNTVQPVYLTPAPTVIYRDRPVYRTTGSSFSISFGDRPYYTHGRYYNPHYWDKHWDHHRRHYRDDDRGRGRGRGHGHGRH